METLTTHGIKVSVKSTFNNEFSHIDKGIFIFTYQITIQNTNLFRVKLKERKWYIFDSIDLPKIVTGTGVVGEQPVLSYNESYTYTSYCELKSEIGKMNGIYLFKNYEDNSNIIVDIPAFKLEAPFKLN